MQEALELYKDGGKIKVKKYDSVTTSQVATKGKTDKGFAGKKIDKEVELTPREKAWQDQILKAVKDGHYEKAVAADDPSSPDVEVMGDYETCNIYNDDGRKLTTIKLK